jgi:hypothetical protein
MTDKEAMKLALFALDIVKIHYTQNRHINEAITALKERLAQPAQRTWVGLTDDEHCDIWYKESLDWMEYGKAIEAKLKEKNT